MSEKIRLKEIIEKAYEPGVVRFKKDEWEYIMVEFFKEVRDAMKDPQWNTIALSKFGTFRVKPVTTVVEASKRIAAYEVGMIDDETMEFYIKRILNASTRSRRAAEKIATLFPHFDRGLRGAPWWPSYRDAIRAGIESYDRDASGDAADEL